MDLKHYLYKWKQKSLHISIDTCFTINGLFVEIHRCQVSYLSINLKTIDANEDGIRNQSAAGSDIFTACKLTVWFKWLLINEAHTATLLLYKLINEAHTATLLQASLTLNYYALL